MIVGCNITKNYVTFCIETESDEERVGIGQQGKEINLIDHKFSYKIPDGGLSSRPHPDLLALTVVAALQPFIKDKITFPYAVSSKFASSLEKAFNIQATNINTKLKPRVPGKKNGLAFSGGADSLACELIMPRDTIKFTYIRVDHPKIEPRKDNFYKTTVTVAKEFDSILCESDLEYIVGPFLQWATWVALSTPMFLYADEFSLKSLAYGLPAEGPYLSYKNNEKRYYGNTWVMLYRAVGLDMVFPICGLTEYGTVRIVKENNLLDKSTSCQLGEYQKPCRQCVKCFRKDVIMCSQGIISKRKFRKSLSKYVESAKVQNLILLAHIENLEHQDIYMYCMKNWIFLPKPFSLFRRKILLDKNCNNVDWVAKNNYKELAKNIVDSGTHTALKRNIGTHVEEMTDADYIELKKWHLLPDVYRQKDIKSKINHIDRSIEQYLVAKNIKK